MVRQGQEPAVELALLAHKDGINDRFSGGHTTAGGRVTQEQLPRSCVQERHKIAK
jgi:hypothetical protein